MDNYPDDVPAGSLRAPWNQPDHSEDPLVCDSCHEEPTDVDAAELGGPCQNVQPEYDRAGNEIPPCEGKYQTTRCDQCGFINCNCE